VDLVLAISPTGKGVVVLLFTGIAAPLAGILFRHVSVGWDAVGKGAFAIEQELPAVPRYRARPAQPPDPAIQAAEVRQMLKAKSERRTQRGEAPIDVEAEATRLLAAPAEVDGIAARQDAALRAEIRQMVVARNERRMRKGMEPLDVEAEIERQLVDFVGSR
jgi:hypothetical protein